MLPIKQKQSKLTNYFLSKNKPESLSTSEVANCNENNNTEENDKELAVPEVTDSIPSECVYNSDIAYFVERKNSGFILQDTEKLQILEIKLNLNDQHVFPSTLYGKRRRSFQTSWLETYSWLVYSKLLDKVFCRHCFVYGKLNVGKGGHENSNLADTGINRWKNILEKLKNHEMTDYHITAQFCNDELVSILKQKKLSIVNQIDSRRKQEVLKNRQSLKAIVETILLCGRQGLALRGHREYEKNTSMDSINRGNFKALLDYRILSGDSALKNHMESAPRNAVYTSPDIQNEIIAICGDLTLQKVVQKINKAKCFSVLADKTTDISNIEQLTICARYYDNEQQKMREDFLAFVQVTDLTGEGIANKILATLKKLGVKTKYLRGQGYDGAANMSGKFKGVQAIIREKFPSATYTHCSSHKLNLCIGEACAIKEIELAFAIIRKVLKFFSKSPKRSQILTKLIQNSELPNEKKKKLIRMCDTRWVERHDCVIRFVDLLEVIVQAMEDISELKEADAKTKLKIRTLLSGIQNSGFIAGVKCASVLLAMTMPLSVNLQEKNIDYISCFDMVKEIIDAISAMRENAEIEFKNIFCEVEALCEKLDITIQLPRKCKRQSYRSNYPTTDPESFYRQSIFIPFVDHFVSELNETFGSANENIKLLVKLMPQNVSDSRDSNYINNLVKTYDKEVHCTTTFEEELRRWKLKCSKMGTELPKNAIEVLGVCDASSFPIIFKLLKILATIPVTTATAERSFSTLKRLKTYLRSTMGEDRLLGLTLLNIYRETGVTPEEIIQVFVMKKTRALDFVV